ncbi:hypothetical protein AXG93_3846s1150 [Marchantia polymorpha subsp. ruderalis]|uniref:Uncharacterized protein n=1 Tax=Marchantia polymorpha subsp. ruderalis TaxID=1480154 RepID=A0A176VMF2_MARPO|nr:hypothetical protein AXG93_3846s1150 [Marchantia polymorpha subsp. ruderalis]
MSNSSSHGDADAYVSGAVALLRRPAVDVVVAISGCSLSKQWAEGSTVSVGVGVIICFDVGKEERRGSSRGCEA